MEEEIVKLRKRLDVLELKVLELGYKSHEYKRVDHYCGCCDNKRYRTAYSLDGSMDKLMGPCDCCFPKLIVP